MSAVPDPVRPRYLRTPDAAVHLGLSPRTLEKHRCYGTGPVYHKLGGRIVYRPEDLDAWAEQGLRRSTQLNEPPFLMRKTSPRDRQTSKNSILT